ncbi:MAG: dienelactone hydrolase family protein [Polyangia bacterium]
MSAAEIQLPDEPSTPAYASVPEGATRGMVVLHEVYGRTPEIDAVVDRFAARGYAACAPRLFAHGTLSCLRSVFAALANGKPIPQTKIATAARQWLCEEASLTEAQIGLIGFCFGGSFALLAGAGFGAVSTNYGAIPPSRAMEGIGPVIACYGGRDLMSRGNDVKLRERLAVVGVEPEVHVFPDAGHAFLTNGDHPIAFALSWPIMHISYDQDRADGGWAKIDAFFDRHLPRSSSSATP